MQKKLIFGAREIGGPPSYKQCDERKAIELLQYAYEKGIRSFDTAPIYGNGNSEKLIGKGLKDVRSGIEIITKFGIRKDERGREYFSYTKQSIQEELEQSLERLQTDYVDSYLLHMPGEGLLVDEVIESLEYFKNKGYIKRYGVSNCYTNLLSEFIQKGNIEVVQDFFNLLYSDTKTLIFPYLNEQVEFQAYGPLYRGLLTEQSFGDLLRRDEGAINRLLKNQNIKQILKKLEGLKAIAGKKGLKIEELAYQYLLSHQMVDSLLIGTTRKDHLDFACECRNVFGKTD